MPLIVNTDAWHVGQLHRAVVITPEVVRVNWSAVPGGKDQIVVVPFAIMVLPPHGLLETEATGGQGRLTYYCQLTPPIVGVTFA
jgi:hypothetical protein